MPKEFVQTLVIVKQTQEWVEKLEKKMTLENLNHLLDEVNINPIKVEII